MSGEGSGDGSPTRGDASFDLGAVVASLSDPDPAVRAQGVATVRRTVDVEPAICLPTVPKLRSILGTSTPDVHREVAYCLEKLAAESPDDVAPSVPAIVEFLLESPESPESPEATDYETTNRLLGCLERVAEERPNAIVDHLEPIAANLPAHGRGSLKRWLEPDATSEREGVATNDGSPSEDVPERVADLRIE